jgi:hypothetical protein
MFIGSAVECHGHGYLLFEVLRIVSASAEVGLPQVAAWQQTTHDGSVHDVNQLRDCFYRWPGSMTTGQSLTNANAAYELADRVRTLWGEASDNLDIYGTCDVTKKWSPCDEKNIDRTCGWRNRRNRHDCEPDSGGS